VEDHRNKPQCLQGNRGHLNSCQSLLDEQTQ
jgi:hypothetical protein